MTIVDDFPEAAVAGTARARRAIAEAIPILEDFLEALEGAPGPRDHATIAFVEHGLARYAEVLSRP